MGEDSGIERRIVSREDFNADRAVAEYRAHAKAETINIKRGQDHRLARALIVADAERRLEADDFKAFLEKIECAYSTSRELLKIAKAGNADDVRRATRLRVADHRARSVTSRVTEAEPRRSSTDVPPRHVTGNDVDAEASAAKRKRGAEIDLEPDEQEENVLDIDVNGDAELAELDKITSFLDWCLHVMDGCYYSGPVNAEVLGSLNLAIQKLTNLRDAMKAKHAELDELADGDLSIPASLRRSA